MSFFYFLRLTLKKILICSPESRRALSLMVSTGNSTASARTEPTVPLSALAKTDTFRCLGLRRENGEFHKKNGCLDFERNFYKWLYETYANDYTLTRYIFIHMGVDLNSFFSKRPFLAKKNYFSQTFAISTKNFRGALCWITCGNFW